MEGGEWEPTVRHYDRGYGGVYEHVLTADGCAISIFSRSTRGGVERVDGGCASIKRGRWTKGFFDVRRSI